MVRHGTKQRGDKMLKFVVGVVLGWFAHLHYGETIMAGIARLVGER